MAGVFRVAQHPGASGNFYARCIFCLSLAQNNIFRINGELISFQCFHKSGRDAQVLPAPGRALPPDEAGHGDAANLDRVARCMTEIKWHGFRVLQFMNYRHTWARSNFEGGGVQIFAPGRRVVKNSPGRGMKWARGWIPLG